MALQTGFRTGLTGAINSYNARDHVAEIEYNFTTYDARLARYWHNRRYADNTIYHAVNTYASLYKFKESLYKHIRALRNPVGRLVQMETAKIFGGAIDLDNFETGAIILNNADDILLQAIRTIFQWSNMGTLKNLYAREGATMGDIALKIVDDVDSEKVRIELLDPRKVFDIKLDSVGNVIFIDIRFDRWDEFANQWYEYRETIDKEWFRTYKNGSLFAYVLDVEGNGLAEWQNPYGFVPVEWTQHVDVGLGFGVTSFHHVRHKIDNLNDVATLIHDNVRKMVNAKFAVTGAKPKETVAGTPDTVTTTDDNRDKSPFLYLGDNGAIEPIVSPIDIEGALAVQIDQQREIESDLPQLALQRMRERSGTLSGIAIENLYSDAVDIINELQATYRDGLKSATQMAISIAAFRRYPDFTSYNLNSFENKELDFEIKPRVLFKDGLSVKERLELTNVALTSNAPELMLKQLDYDDDDINSALGRAERSNLRQSALTLRNGARGLNREPIDTIQVSTTDENIEAVV